MENYPNAISTNKGIMFRTGETYLYIAEHKIEKLNKEEADYRVLKDMSKYTWINSLSLFLIVVGIVYFSLNILIGGIFSFILSSYLLKNHSELTKYHGAEHKVFKAYYNDGEVSEQSSYARDCGIRKPVLDFILRSSAFLILRLLIGLSTGVSLFCALFLINLDYYRAPNSLRELSIKISIIIQKLITVSDPEKKHLDLAIYGWELAMSGGE